MSRDRLGEEREKSMRQENKITIPEIHERLNARAGREVSPRHLSILLACWRIHRRSKSRGRQGWLRESDALDFLDYAWYPRRGGV